MEPKTYFIIGVNGIGKTTVLERLKELLPEETFALYDFDQRGVPDNAGKDWRQKETHSWILLGEVNKQDGKSTVVCGFAKPEEIEEMSKDMENKPIMILLDGTTRTITERIQNRYLSEESVKELTRTMGKSVEKFIADNVYYAELLRQLRFIHKYKIVKTDDRTPTEISADIMQFIFSGERGTGE